MTDALSLLAGLALKAGLILIAANEIRGLIMTAPVFFAMYQAGGTLVAIWLGFCSLAGIAISVLGPLFIAHKLKLTSRVPRSSRCSSV